MIHISTSAASLLAAFSFGTMERANSGASLTPRKDIQPVMAITFDGCLVLGSLQSSKTRTPTRSFLRSSQAPSVLPSFRAWVGISRKTSESCFGPLGAPVSCVGVWTARFPCPPWHEPQGSLSETHQKQRPKLFHSVVSSSIDSSTVSLVLGVSPHSSK